mmetsp:Transcript_12560/g.41118  ORF Transcript_12560/g.41118 Transcript_12560/m.41118 type:complete len:297 (+) Transcript_12560:1026-1916(+)|eukprot:CAMPEP_0118912410 /NCGR_PEP_ID=MMETSP1166-20130328/13671_1 /TAXON_ID=1104430 /ORGANISM="Chrysoreinhardia sp, Strain CCMP3193" /LENGTH=296 /DNA_ID=CAMNT_0006851929 /DNA_START=616 /DNA_END=1506 /DNA_ORIENTATION=+
MEHSIFFVLTTTTSLWRVVALSSTLPFTQLTVQDLVVQRAVQHQVAALRSQRPSSCAFLSTFLGHDLPEACSRLDGLRCPGDEYLLALQVAPKRGDVEPAWLTARVAAAAFDLADAWIGDLDLLADRDERGLRADALADDDDGLERWCTLQATATLVERRADALSRAARRFNRQATIHHHDLVPDFIDDHQKDTSLRPRSVLAAQANLSVVAAFAGFWMPKLVDGADHRDSPERALDALSTWAPPPDLPGGYLVESARLAEALRGCRGQIARKAARRLDSFRRYDLFDFVPPHFTA